MAWSQRSPYLYVNDQAPIGLQYNQTTLVWETVFLDENQNKFVPLSDLFSNPVAPLPVPTNGTDLTLTGFLSAGGRVQAGTHFRAPNDTNPATPVYSITGATDKGIYPTTNGIGFAVGGSRVGEFQSWGGGFTGNVIQLQNSTNTFDQSNATSGSYSDVNSAVATPWEVTITPRYTNSKIIIMYSINFYITTSTASAYAGFRIDRKIGAGAYSNIYENQRDNTGPYMYGQSVGGASSSTMYTQGTILYIDQPNTTSIVTYKLLYRPYSGTSMGMNISQTQSNGKSYCILQEVQQ